MVSSLMYHVRAQEHGRVHRNKLVFLIESAIRLASFEISNDFIALKG